jgi:hypothetical protein
MKFGKIVAVFVAAATLIPAAARAEGKIAIGPQGGLTFPDFHVKDQTLASTYSNKNGWAAGVFAEFGVWAITLRPEANFVTKGYTVANVGTVKNQYVEIPVLLKFNPFGEFGVSPFIVVGPQWSKKIGETDNFVNGVTSYNNTVTDWDISGVAGLGFDFNFSKHLALELQGRYSYGFRNVNTSSASNIYMRGFYLLGGLSIQDAF